MLWSGAFLSLLSPLLFHQTRAAGIWTSWRLFNAIPRSKNSVPESQILDPVEYILLKIPIRIVKTSFRRRPGWQRNEEQVGRPKERPRPAVLIESLRRSGCGDPAWGFGWGLKFLPTGGHPAALDQSTAFFPNSFKILSAWRCPRGIMTLQLEMAFVNFCTAKFIKTFLPFQEMIYFLLLNWMSVDYNLQALL